MRPGFTTIFSAAWRLWRADWNVLVALAGPFLFLPPLAVNLLLAPDLDRAMAALAPDDTNGRMQVFSAWMQGAAPWLILAQIVIQFGTLTILKFYLDRDRVTVGSALSAAVRWLPGYLLAMVLSAIGSFAGLVVLIVGYFYVMGRLSLTGAVIAAERETNPVAAIARSLKLTRGSGLILMGLILLIYCATFFLQTPIEQVQQWMATNAPNPVAEAMVGVVVAGLSGLSFVAIALVQVVAYRQFTASGGTRYSDIFG